MIKVNVSSNFVSNTYEVDESTTTVRSVLDQAGIDYNRFQVLLGAQTVTKTKLYQTFVQLGVYDDCFLSTTTKADSAFA